MNFPPVKIGLFTSHHCYAQLPTLTTVLIKYCEKLYYAILALITSLLLHHYIYEIFYRIFYRPQTKFAKVMFLQASVCPRGGACSGGGVPAPGGACSPPPTATAVGGTHPTGMHSCLCCVHCGRISGEFLIWGGGGARPRAGIYQATLDKISPKTLAGRFPVNPWGNEPHISQWRIQDFPDEGGGGGAPTPEFEAKPIILQEFC